MTPDDTTRFILAHTACNQAMRAVWLSVLEEIRALPVAEPRKVA